MAKKSFKRNVSHVLSIQVKWIPQFQFGEIKSRVKSANLQLRLHCKLCNLRFRLINLISCSAFKLKASTQIYQRKLEHIILSIY